jgi:uncharacterized membrane protein
MRSILKNISFIVLAAVLMVGLVPAQAFAADQRVTITREGGYNITQNGTAYMDVTANATESTPYALSINTDSDIEVVTGGAGTISAPGKTTVTFQLRALKGAREGDHQITVYATDPVDRNRIYGQRGFVITVEKDINSFSSMEGVAADVSYTVDGGDTLTAGKTNELKLYLFNRGASTIRNTKVQIVLPQGLSIKSGSDTVNIGYFESGKTLSAAFTLVSDSSLSGSVPIDVVISGVKFDDGDTANFTTKVYIPVSGSGSSATVDDLEIVSVQVPETVNQDQEFMLSFAVKNNGTAEAKDLTATVEIPAGISNLTKSIFNIKSLAAGATASYSVRCKSGTTGGSQNFRISVAPSSGEGRGVSDYAVVTVKSKDESGNGNGSESKPVLMVSDYSYGGASVKAGTDFDFTITLLNTSNKTIRNIKATIGSKDFIPIGSSNSFYIASIPAGGTSTKTIHMNCLGETPQGPSSVSVTTEFEYGEGSASGGNDTISVPVIQETRFVVDEILDPGYLMLGEQAYITVNYYNMGKQQLNNLRVAVEGDFSVDGSASTYVGNMASGRSDYYNFRFYPNAEGPCSGKVTFTFEDAAGNETVVEKDFTFNIQPAPVWDDPGDYPVEPVKQGLPLWAKIAIPVAAVAALVIVLKVLKAHKKKKNEALELEDE